jgi:uncharacterized membrane protein YphA (DoxX/SURF4 family)
MNVALWISQVVLAAVFLASGTAKSTMSPKHMVETGQTGTAVYPLPVVRFPASMELLAVAGLILPWATGIAKVLTPLAAVGLCAVMIGAASAHVRLHEPRNVAVNTVLFSLAVFVVVGRLAGLS